MAVLSLTGTLALHLRIMDAAQGSWQRLENTQSSLYCEKPLKELIVSGPRRRRDLLPAGPRHPCIPRRSDHGVPGRPTSSAPESLCAFLELTNTLEENEEWVACPDDRGH